MSAYSRIKSERFYEIVGGFMALTGRFCEIPFTTNIILLSMVRGGDIFKCVHTSGIYGLLKDIASFDFNMQHFLKHFYGFPYNFTLLSLKWAIL